jgi:broad specificity phosphatase PhoE
MRRWYEDGNLAARLEGGESFHDMEARFRATLSRVRLKHEEAGGTVLCLTHGALLCSMLPLVIENLTTDRIVHLGLGNAIPIETRFDKGRGVCIRWDDQVLE